MAIDGTTLHDSAREIARIGGAKTLEYFRRRELEVERKTDESPVTVADRETERVIRSAISDRFPGHSIVGEELGGETPPSGVSWLVDPINGTKSFIRGVPLYTTLIAVLVDGKPVVGVIYAPATGEMVSACRGGGAWDERGAPVHAAADVPLEEAWVLVTDPVDLARRQPTMAAAVMNRAKAVRTWADAYGYMLVARGDAHCMVDPIMSPWDVGPLGVVIEEAGGTFTSLFGDRDPLPSNCIAACGAGIHAEIVDLARPEV